MQLLWSQYSNILVFFIFSLLLSAIIILLSYLLASQQSDNEKLSAYECGFTPFDDARNKFDVKFYVVAILFIVFDLEVSLLFPWVAAVDTISTVAYWSVFVFLVILTIGFIYEWIKGALDW
jgi:NADH-quinone oxidoreductase subunit A